MFAAGAARSAPVPPKDNLKITKLETFLVKPRWLFLKIHTDAGIVGPGRADPRRPRADLRRRRSRRSSRTWSARTRGRVVHHWQAIYRHAFYRGGPILTSALSGIDQALWDIKGKALGVPVYELLGGPTRDRVRVYAHAGTPEAMQGGHGAGLHRLQDRPGQAAPGALRRDPGRRRRTRPSSSPRCARRSGNDVDIGIDFHGAISPATAKLLIKALEPYQPMFIEEPCQCQNVDVMAEIARGTHLPIATGERVFTKWGFREVLEKQAATILQPDLCHAGGITEVRLIAGMAEAYYAADRAAQPAGADLAGGRHPARRLHPELPLPGAGLARRGLPEEAVHGARTATSTCPPGPGLGIELDENAHGRQDRPRLAQPARATTPTTARWWTGSAWKRCCWSASRDRANPPSTASAFFDTHVRISLDMLKTRHRERILLHACLLRAAAVRGG